MIAIVTILLLLLDEKMADTIHQVSFVDVKESYPPGSSIQCRYVVKGPHVCSNKDWIGIYRVGWRSCNNYEAYVWVQMPPATDESQEVECEGTVTFPGWHYFESKVFFVKYNYTIYNNYNYTS